MFPSTKIKVSGVLIWPFRVLFERFGLCFACSGAMTEVISIYTHPLLSFGISQFRPGEKREEEEREEEKWEEEKWVEERGEKKGREEGERR